MPMYLFCNQKQRAWEALLPAEAKTQNEMSVMNAEL